MTNPATARESVGTHPLQSIIEIPRVLRERPGEQRALIPPDSHRNLQRPGEHIPGLEPERQLHLVPDRNIAGRGRAPR